ncbi:unnamed protein product [Discula destructiva]
MWWFRMLLTVASTATATATATATHASTSQKAIRAANSTTPTNRWPAGLSIGIDYYPSQWPESMWEPDIAAMAALNVSYVRVNEFDWAVLEPTEGAYNFTILDITLALLDQYGLRAVIGTPTASPPAWLMAKYDINFVDVTNTSYVFGSRRYYSFSSPDYRQQSQRITRVLAERYGTNPIVAGWQLDNEFGCHGTVRSYDAHAIARFRGWLATKYGTVAALNAAQGRVFWSNQYQAFADVLPPFLEVYTTNELHTLDWYAFSSDMVAEFALEQADILRELAPTQAITTNMMMDFTDFDHHAFARKVGIDIAFYDSYPLATPGMFPNLADPELTATLRTGRPDMQALHHALYRGVAGASYGQTAGPFGVMEMEPGVLNWNTYRVAPQDGIVRLWTLETFAASGDVVSYFRWRQAPYAQEQTLSGLHISDGSQDAGFSEASDVSLLDLPVLREGLGASVPSQEPQADVALVFDYTSAWVWAIEPYSGSWDPSSASYTGALLQYHDLVYPFYSALRRLGLSVDVIGPDQPLTGYKMLVIPTMPILPAALNTALASYTDGPVVLGPRSAALTADFAYAPGIQPSAGAVRDNLPLRVTRIETPPSYANSGVAYGGANYSITFWEEWVECARGNASSRATVTSTSAHRLGKAAACASGSENEAAAAWHYLGFNPPVDFLVSYLGDVAADAGLSDLTGRAASKENDLGSSLRLLRRGNLLWAFNYGPEAVAAPEVAQSAELIVGETGEIPASGVVVWKIAS